MTLIIAHRGASRAEPENTVIAFRRAVELGADGVELDVRRTGDDRLVVHHDAHLADGRAIRHTPVDDLPEHVPSLAVALDACDGAFVNIEIKNDPDEPDFDPTEWVAHRVGVELAGRDTDRRWLISSFRWETVATSRRLLPSVRTGWLVVDLDDGMIDRCARDGHDAIHPWVGSVTPAAITAAHGAGLAVNTWTCDDPARMAELIALGVDGICTNVPDLARRVRGSASG